MAAPLGAAVLLSLLAAGRALRCYQCVGMFQECVQAEQRCGARDRACFSSSIRLFNTKENQSGVVMLPGLEQAEYVLKGCSGENAENRTAKVYVGGEREVHDTYFCASDLCNGPFTGVPSASAPQPNGMACYSCFDRGTGDCAPGNATPVPCAGDMTQCMDFTVTDGAWHLTYRTCALETLCRQQYQLPQLHGRLDISCCSTPLCNDGRPGLRSLCSHFSQQGPSLRTYSHGAHLPPAGTRRQPENGLHCASCCETGHEAGRTLVRGCSLERLCHERPRGLGLSRGAAVRCCEGALCNGGEDPGAGPSSLLLLLPPLLGLIRLL
ncbi:urokinase plasminogen activator surface receptor isoform X3 [Alligator mississippiensis]|uniref:urokinase plasminogen activator surface receptor isoform X3 n=1 Tax=Alligator mississippiensis TaxID=8496 RepID=UPI002877B19D|nr:urokinase plasminogen activator surface receptor isoform X3 [Alligator mississippiensis]